VSEQSHTIETRIIRVSVREGKLPSVLIDLNGTETWLTRSIDQYYSGVDVTPALAGKAVSLTFKGTFLSAINKVLEPYVATDADMNEPPDILWEEEGRATSQPPHRDPTRQSIERQVSLKCATEIMVALITHRAGVASGAEVAAEVAAMASVLWAAIEE
jgi:hypothetical protein